MVSSSEPPFSKHYQSRGKATKKIHQIPQVLYNKISYFNMIAKPMLSSMFRQAARPAVFASKFSTPRFSPIASRYLSTEVRKQIDQVVGSKPVVLFMKGTPESPMCGFSKATIQILSLQGLNPEKFAALNVLEDEGLRQGIKEYSEWPTIPQLYVNKEFIGGCDILIAMHQSGELAKVLEENKVLVEESS
ncbi:putative monothiol glutaredoxin-5 protein [Botrytis fragariae]|uniref:Monothiol glutaredoxin-5, mitochondrial n=1 Tax=Botrytis fragariae TaxID=1964551 RepID=A0A8H6ALD1_9HELO|nr:putative monothiol glutaredoxin-5 protein [Botrytis fragariae]KAF5869395.1 putative monothiol glutaredoxin-5 protein [Botrytis fragariae]